MNLIINRILVLEDPEHFSDMGAFPPGTVKGWITDLIRSKQGGQKCCVDCRWGIH